MAGTDLALLITALSSVIAALLSFYINIHKNKGEQTVAVRSTALVEMEASLKSRADDYNRILAEVLGLREEVTSLHKEVDKLMNENRALRARHLDWEPVQ